MEKIAMITGASGGLGKAVGKRLKASGWTIVRVGRTQEKLEDWDDADDFSIVADVSTSDGANLAVERCAELGGKAPVGLVNCAGSVLILPMHRTKEEQYRQIILDNLDTAFFTLRAFVNALVRSKQSGAAVLVSSVAARIGIANHEAIGAVKSAVEGLVRSASATYAKKGIRVNAIAPGLMRSPATEHFFINESAEKQIAAQYPLGHYGSVEDGAAAITWLLSEEAGWITGQTISVDGGFSAVRPVLR
jgi:NAD(P)-dependent dehydrogenase (short-subunit alcohol dehydrogenase family)